MTLFGIDWRFIALAVLAGLLGLQTVRIAELKQEAADKRATDAESGRMAERAQRATETRWRNTIDKEVGNAQTKILQATADAADAVVAADSLRVARDAALGRARAATCAAAPSAAKPADDAPGMLAFVQQRVDARAGVLARVADERGNAGGLCERVADRIRAEQVKP